MKHIIETKSTIYKSLCSFRFFVISGIALIFFALLTFSCSNFNKNSDSFTIHGQFSNCTGEKILLEEMDINAIIPLDSANIDHEGNIRFTHKTNQAGFYLLRFPDRKKILLLLDKNENLEIAGDCQKPAEDLILKGSQETLLLTNFFKTTNRKRKTVDSLKAVIHAHEDNPDFLKISADADAGFQRISENQRKLELEFIINNPNSLACLIVLNFSFGPRPILDIDHDFFYYQKVDSCLQIIYPNNKHVIYHHQRVMERKRQESVKRLKETSTKRE